MDALVYEAFLISLLKYLFSWRNFKNFNFKHNFYIVFSET